MLLSLWVDTTLGNFFNWKNSLFYLCVCVCEGEGIVICLEKLGNTEEKRDHLELSLEAE